MRLATLLLVLVGGCVCSSSHELPDAACVAAPLEERTTTAEEACAQLRVQRARFEAACDLPCPFTRDVSPAELGACYAAVEVAEGCEAYAGAIAACECR